MIFRKFQKQDIQSTIELLNSCFNQSNITQQSFEWKYFDNYFDNQAVAFVAIENDIIVGFACFLPMWRMNKKVWLCAVVASHPNYRKMGIAKRLTLECEKIIGTDATYFGFSNNDGIKIDQNSKFIAYQILGQIVASNFVPMPVLQNSYKFIAQNVFKINKPELDLFETSKDIEYYQWRYGNNPKVNYEYVNIYNNGELLGFIATRESFCRVEIYEINIKQGFLDSNLIHEIVNWYFWKGKIVNIRYLPNDNWQRRLKLPKITFPIQQFLTVKSPDPDLLDPNQWDVIGGDLL